MFDIRLASSQDLDRLNADMRRWKEASRPKPEQDQDPVEVDNPAQLDLFKGR
jgi:hypothetical protein